METWRSEPDEDDYDDRTMTITRLALLMLAGAVILAAVILGACRATTALASGGPAHMACSHPALPMPRTVVIRPGIDPGPWRAAIAEWNAFAARTVGSSRLRFVEVGQWYEADVYIVPASLHTWVDMPCGRVESVVYVGDEGTDLWYWASHELGNTLGLADHIGPDMPDTGRYLNPGRCPGDGYDGIMSYCTPRARWWGGDDVAMVGWWF